MQTIVLATQKGGSGKSALAIGLALAAIRAGHNVRLIETDPQGTVSNWKRRRPYAAPIIEPIYAAREVEQRLQSLAHDGVTVTIVDTAGGESAATNSAIRYSDLCLIPTRPSIADIEATAATLRVIRAWHKPFAYVLNQTPIPDGMRILQLPPEFSGLEVITPELVARTTTDGLPIWVWPGSSCPGAIRRTICRLELSSSGNRSMISAYCK